MQARSYPFLDFFAENISKWHIFPEHERESLNVLGLDRALSS
jgi:hypothetical protein